MSEHTPGPWEAVPEQRPTYEIIARVADYDIIRTDGQMVDEYAIDADAHLIAAAPDLKLAAEGGNETEDIYIRELQRIAGPDAELSTEAQARLHQLRQQRYAAIAKARKGCADG